MYYQYTTQIPMPFMLAQTWDTDAVEKAGAILAAEMEWLHIGLWLAPSLNIHRDPLCGRNFEYYSEDPLISGLMAAHETLGLQASGKYGVTLKHFACNNQETNRSGVSANVTERTLREIYLKGFEIAVRKADPRAIMTSYNLINGIHTANDYELLTRVARCEWGFNGLIMTDWGTTGGGRGRRRPGAPDGADAGYPGATAPGCMAAGNDLVMSGTPGDIEAIVDDLDSGVLALADVQHCAKHILNVILRSFHFALEP